MLATEKESFMRVGKALASLSASLFILGFASRSSARTERCGTPASRQRPSVTRNMRPSPSASFSNPPTDAEITHARIFEEPLVPVGAEDAPAHLGDENCALVEALKTWRESAE